MERHAGNGLEADAVHPACIAEDARADVLHLEVLHRLGFVEGIAGLADALGIVHIVPGLDSAAGGKQARGDVLVHDLLHVTHFLLGTLHRRFHYAGEEGIHGLRVAGHLVLEYHLRGVVVTHDVRLLDAEFHYAEHRGLVVVGIAVVAAHRIEAEHLLAEGAVSGHGHIVIVGCDGPAGLGLVGVALGKQMVAEGVAEGSELTVDFA